MDCNNLQQKGYITSTGKGKKVSLYVRVYPQGFGQIILRRNEPPTAPLELMCNNADEAAEYIREIWNCLVQTDQSSAE